MERGYCYRDRSVIDPKFYYDTEKTNA